MSLCSWTNSNKLRNKRIPLRGVKYFKMGRVPLIVIVGCDAIENLILQLAQQ